MISPPYNAFSDFILFFSCKRINFFRLKCQAKLTVTFLCLGERTCDGAPWKTARVLLGRKYDLWHSCNYETASHFVLELAGCHFIATGIFFSFPKRRLWLRVPLHGAFRFWTYRSDSANGFGNNPILFPRSWLAMFDRRDLVTGDENKITFAFKKHLFKGYFIFRRPCVVGSWIYSSVSQV